MHDIGNRMGFKVNQIGPVHPTVEGGYQAALALEGGDTTAIITYNDLIAVGIVLRFTADGVNVPGDVSVLDLDNTLSMHGNPAAENGIPEWLEHMKNIGVPMRIVSNNTNKRVAPLAKKLGLPFTANGCKPLTFGISKAIKIMGVPKKQVAVVGDQIFTDVIAGNIKGAVSVLVEPFHMESAWTFKLKRKAESLFFHRDYSKLETKEKK